MLKKSTLNIYLFAILSVIYYLLNILFPTDFSLDADNGSRIWPQIAGALLAVFCTSVLVLNFQRVMLNKMMRLFMAYLLLAILYILYPFNVVDNISFFVRSYMAIIYMLAFYSIASNSRHSVLWHKSVYLIFAFQIGYCLFTLIHDYLFMPSISEEGFDSNSGFMLLTCIPMALLFPVKRIRVYLYLLLLICCVFSGQRSAAFSSMISLPFCLVYLKNDIRPKDILIIMLLLLIFGVPVLNNAFENIALRNSVDESRDNYGSGRLIFWGIVLHSFFEGDIAHLFLGNGTNSVALLLESSYGIAIGAHNGWLDMLYTFGFIGVFLYAVIVFSLLARSHHFKRIFMPYRMLYLIMFVIFIVRCSTSHGYFDISMMPFCLAIAIVESLNSQRYQLVNNVFSDESN